MPPRLDEDSQTERVQLVVTRKWAEGVDEWRRRHPDLPNRSKAIRMLVELALQKDATSDGSIARA